MKARLLFLSIGFLLLAAPAIPRALSGDSTVQPAAAIAPPPPPATHSLESLRLPAPLPRQSAPPGTGKLPAPNTITSVEPAPTDWGSLDSPRIGPIRFPSVNYLLAGPSPCVLESETASAYRRDVNDPGRLLPEDSRYNMAINLYRPDGLAPIGVLYDHTLKGGGQLLLSYRYFVTHFQGERAGTRNIPIEQVLADFPIAPRRMTQEQHLLLLEWAPTDSLTLTANLPFQQTNISQLSRDGTLIESTNMNPGDIPISAIFVLKRWQRHQLHANFGLSIPTGMTYWLGNLPNMTSPEFAYPLRSSSGTYDLVPGITYRGQNDRWTWGAQSTGIIRLGLNRFNYRLGDQIDLTAWVSRRVSDRASISARLDDLMVGNIHRFDPRINQALVPTDVPSLQAFERTNLLFGLNYYFPDGRLPGQRFGFEAGFPVFQWVSGPQLGARWTLNAGWNMIW